jgi:hypothetical protein
MVHASLRRQNSTLSHSLTSQQFNCLAKLITIHINISLCGADMMGIVSPLLTFFLIHFHWKQTSFSAIFE